MPAIPSMRDAASLLLIEGSMSKESRMLNEWMAKSLLFGAIVKAVKSFYSKAFVQVDPYANRIPV